MNVKNSGGFALPLFLHHFLTFSKGFITCYLQHTLELRNKTAF